MRAEAATEMEKAIESCRLRVNKEEAALSSLAADKVEDAKKQVVDVKEMIEDMEQRVSFLLIRTTISMTLTIDSAHRPPRSCHLPLCTIQPSWCS